ncbi:MAG: hypothetical protein LWY06_18890 [Firmicutes bacterium]|nr:hypothetical protein [Bacillota bacterium]
MVFNTLSFQSPKNMKVNKLPDGLELSFLPDRSIGSIFSIVFLCIWLIGWFIGETAVLFAFVTGSVKSDSFLFMFLWITMWSLGGFMAINAFLALAFGKRIVTIRHDSLHIIESFGVWRKNNFFPMSRVRNLRRDSEKKMGNYGSYILHVISVDCNKNQTVLISSRDEKELDQPYELLKESGLFGPVMLSGYISSAKQTETISQAPQLQSEKKDEADLRPDSGGEEKASEDNMYFPDIPDDLK